MAERYFGLKAYGLLTATGIIAGGAGYLDSTPRQARYDQAQRRAAIGLVAEGITRPAHEAEVKARATILSIETPSIKPSDDRPYYLQHANYIVEHISELKRAVQIENQEQWYRTELFKHTEKYAPPSPARDIIDGIGVIGGVGVAAAAQILGGVSEAIYLGGVATNAIRRRRKTRDS